MVNHHLASPESLSGVDGEDKRARRRRMRVVMSRSVVFLEMVPHGWYVVESLDGIREYVSPLIRYRPNAVSFMTGYVANAAQNNAGECVGEC
jgi:hypothetical protein